MRDSSSSGGAAGGSNFVNCRSWAPPDFWCDEEVLDRFRRGLRELRARGLDAPLPVPGEGD